MTFRHYCYWVSTFPILFGFLPSLITSFDISVIIGLRSIHKGTRQMTSTLWVPWVFGLPSLRTFRLLVFTLKKILYGAFVIRVWCKILLRDIGFHPEAIKILYGASITEVLCRFFFGLLAFTPKQPRLYMETTMSWFYEILFGLGYWLAPKERMSVQMDKGAPKRLSLFVKQRGESSVHSKQECLKEVSTGRRSRVALHLLASLHRH